MPSSTALLSAVVAASAVVHSVAAHGYVSQPKPDFVPGQMYTNFNAEFTAADTKIAAFQGKIFNWSPEQNTGVFTKAFKESGLASLRELMDKFVPGCGNTIETATPRDVSGLTTLTFQNNEYKEGFIASHRGPCEIWFDNTRVFHNDDCAAAYTTFPAVIPVDYSKCKGNCMLKFYWLALHSQKWQAYKQCVPIKNGSGSGAVPAPAPTTKSPVVTPTPATTTKAPTPTTKAPTPTTKAPTPTTKTPAQAPAPAPTKSNCARRSRRVLESEEQ